MSTLILADFYKEAGDNLIIDEIINFYICGMKTMQVAQTNFIYYMTKHQEYRAKLLNEIIPVVDVCRQNILDGLTYDNLMKLDYIKQCFQEVCRIEPPVGISLPMSFEEDTWIGKGDFKVKIKKNMKINILFDAIHHDPQQWPEPNRYVPDRFDTKNYNNKWLLTSDGN